MDLAAAISTLDQVIFERVDARHFIPQGVAPAWYRALAQGAEAGPLVLDEVFPFLTAFLPEAELIWGDTRERCIYSDFWTEQSPDGCELHLEATAARAGGVPFLVIARNERFFNEQALVLQRARELRLTHDAFMREIEQKDILLHTIVHDLTHPLHSIVGALSLLGESDLPPPASRWTEIAVHAAARQRALIEGILDVFAAEQGVVAERVEPSGVSLGEAIDLARIEQEPVARQGHIHIERHDEADLRVVAESTRLVRVITNLVANAIRHSPPGSVVTIHTQGESGDAYLAVEDEGPGVSPELVPRLFQKFAHEPGGGGTTGLGLYFCRITIERWGGTIGYLRRPHGGARFWIRLPLAIAPAESAYLPRLQ